ncbi:MAG: Gfo/Idh/MocA family oxidoreductase [Phycisphaerales bacterium]|nr:Gfo/Idh/MocA family oxidoreductase [Phycisphaerales bacterium]MCB9836335.1 Gfo/Idh/MocA family oxidoreductase [Phycisphaera sp.]
MSSDPIRAGVVGLGFMGQTHVRAYRDAAQDGLPVTLAAVCDADPNRLDPSAQASGNLGSADAAPLFDPSATRTHTDLEDLLADDSIDLVSICTHTTTHVDFAIRALNAGKHCIIEKPVALTLDAVERLLPVAQRAQADGVLCMPAMCMRFWPAWAWIKNAIDSRQYGAVRSAAFTRLGSTPTWADGFYKDISKSGGAILDLHIHDTDFVHFCFGPPAEVTSLGDDSHITTLYRFDDGPAHVTAEGCWDRDPAAPFVMRARVDFERASVEFDLSAEHQLTLYKDGNAHPIDVSPLSGWEMQIRAMVEALARGDTSPPITIDEAARVMRTIEAERESLGTSKPVRIRPR